MKRARIAALALLLPILGGCATYRDLLARGQRAYEHNEHERALAIWRQLDGEQDHLSTEERAQYAYLRGMTDYRIGYRAEARHWLARADALDKATPGSLPADWKTRMTETLAELNDGIYQQGYETLTNVQKRPDPRAEKPVATP
jgi:hypothetical protein